MKKILLKIFEVFLTPVKHFPASFLFLAIALVLPNFVEYILHYTKEPLTTFNYWIPICISISYFLVTIAHFLSKIDQKLATFWIVVVHIAIYALVFTDIFLVKSFGTHINTYLLQVVSETNSQESFEFIQTYTHTKIFAKLLCFILLFIGSEIFFIKRKSLAQWIILPNSWKVGLNKCKYALSSIVGIYLFWSLGFLFYILPCFSLDWAANLEKDIAWDHGVISSFVFKTYQSVLQFSEEHSAFDKCAKSQENITAKLGESPIKNIVVIIGESFNRHHSSLYGYNHETNPRLSKLPHLYVFDDVISPINSTSPVFKYFLSMASTDNGLVWYDTPLFPAFFKQAGYNVIFFSNQFVKRVKMSQYDASAGFFNHPKVEPLIFSHRNIQKHKYDEGLIDEYCEKRTEIENDSLNLIFFHLIGQHVYTRQRYPEGRETFHVNDYQRPELTEEQTQEVADYDNATCYNDSVVYEIINLFQDKDALILYFADHGDEANDYRPHIGRVFNLNNVGAPGLHCQFDIPFMFYLSDHCIIRHPDLEQRIAQSTHRPFMIDDLPHVLFDIADLQTSWFQPSRSLINKEFNEQRRRIINDYTSSTPIDYDSICNDYGDWKIGYKN